jgi:ABC-type molybdenum transport system ATPase subunit/photorepair protein PhrA
MSLAGKNGAWKSTLYQVFWADHTQPEDWAVMLIGKSISAAFHRMMRFGKSAIISKEKISSDTRN